ncbi:hypothetical protein KYC5002_10570 [Archangium violaceum]|uniref:hypothetical protein n=1 Tax=Archangium violaceum TaxID=83451 RepID=UPI002B2A54CC|nr:hypothetical protein KYC5002_10570 [Archangium gephyra]
MRKTRRVRVPEPFHHARTLQTSAPPGVSTVALSAHANETPFPWEALCAEVAKLKVQRHERGQLA